MTSPGYMTPRDPNGPSLENIHAPKCTCGAVKHLVNKELPRLRLKDPVDKVMEEAQQLHMWEDLQDGDTAEPERLSTINDILEVLKLLARKV